MGVKGRYRKHAEAAAWKLRISMESMQKLPHREVIPPTVPRTSYIPNI